MAFEEQDMLLAEHVFDSRDEGVGVQACRDTIAALALLAGQKSSSGHTSDQRLVQYAATQPCAAHRPPSGHGFVHVDGCPGADLDSSCSHDLFYCLASDF